MTINNRLKLQRDVALGRNLDEVLAEILSQGDTLDEFDSFLIQRLSAKYKTLKQIQAEKEEKELMNKLEKKVQEAMDDILGSWK